MGTIGDRPFEGDINSKKIEQAKIQKPAQAKASRIACVFFSLFNRIFGTSRKPIAEKHTVVHSIPMPTSDVDTDVAAHKSEFEDTNLSNLKDLSVDNFMRFLMSKANQSFVSGSFVLRDPGNVLKSYVKNLQQDKNRRFSSHYNKARKEAEYGIDLQSPIFGDKRHVLLTEIDKKKPGGPYYFFKPEEHGVAGVGAVLQHTWKYISIKIQRIWTGGISDEQGSSRKERIPKKPRDIFKRAIKHFPKKTQAELFKDAKSFGISFISEKLEDLYKTSLEKNEKLKKEHEEDSGSIEKEKAFKFANDEFKLINDCREEFKKYLKEEGLDDNLDIRTGREVILNTENLFSS